MKQWLKQFAISVTVLGFVFACAMISGCSKEGKHARQKRAAETENRGTSSRHDEEPPNTLDGIVKKLINKGISKDVKLESLADLATEIAARVDISGLKLDIKTMPSIDRPQEGTICLCDLSLVKSEEIKGSTGLNGLLQMMLILWR